MRQWAHKSYSPERRSGGPGGSRPSTAPSALHILSTGRKCRPGAAGRRGFWLQAASHAARPPTQSAVHAQHTAPEHAAASRLPVQARDLATSSLPERQYRWQLPATNLAGIQALKGDAPSGKLPPAAGSSGLCQNTLLASATVLVSRANILSACAPSNSYCCPLAYMMSPNAYTSLALLKLLDLMTCSQFGPVRRAHARSQWAAKRTINRPSATEAGTHCSPPQLQSTSGVGHDSPRGPASAGCWARRPRPLPAPSS